MRSMSISRARSQISSKAFDRVNVFAAKLNASFSGDFLEVVLYALSHFKFWHDQRHGRHGRERIIWRENVNKMKLSAESLQ